MKCQTIAKNSSRLNSSTKSEDEVEGGLLLDVVIAEGPPVLELLTGEDEPLLVRWDAFLVLKKIYVSICRKSGFLAYAYLNLSLDVFDRV